MLIWLGTFRFFCIRIVIIWHRISALCNCCSHLMSLISVYGSLAFLDWKKIKIWLNLIVNRQILEAPFRHLSVEDDKLGKSCHSMLPELNFVNWEWHANNCQSICTLLLSCIKPSEAWIPLYTVYSVCCSLRECWICYATDLLAFHCLLTLVNLWALRILLRKIISVHDNPSTSH